VAFLSPGGASAAAGISPPGSTVGAATRRCLPAWWKKTRSFCPKALENWGFPGKGKNRAKLQFYLLFYKLLKRQTISKLYENLVAFWEGPHILVLSF
jgi:hypothetical protein